MSPLKIFALTFAFTIFIPADLRNLLKTTNLKCKSHNESWVVFKECRLRAKNREVTLLSTTVEILHPASQVMVNLTLLKRAVGGYKPFIVKFSIDACHFMKQKYNPVAIMTFNLIKDFVNFNHPCPFMGEQYIRDYYPRMELYSLPLPAGEYAAVLSFIFGGYESTFNVDSYFTFYEDLA